MVISHATPAAECPQETRELSVVVLEGLAVQSLDVILSHSHTVTSSVEFGLHYMNGWPRHRHVKPDASGEMEWLVSVRGGIVVRMRGCKGDSMVGKG